MEMSMSMESLIAEAQRRIERDQLGLPLNIYGPPTALTIIGGMIALVVAIAMAGMVWLSFSMPSENGIFLNVFVAFLAVILMIFLSVMSFQSLSRALSDRNMRVVICTRGVAFLRGRDYESFRWQDVLTTFSLTRYKKRPIYTVHCQDGRKFVFQNLSGIEDLAESIDVHVARAKRS